MDDEIAQKLDTLQARIAAAARDSGRKPEDVTLVAVSKQQPPERISAALAAGQRVFGENRVQEARKRWAGLKDSHPGLELHMIGPLQSNKAEDAVALFDVIETIDRPGLAQAVAAAIDRTGKRPRCFIQVNTGAEAQKSGVLPPDADAFIVRCLKEFALPVEGLMCIPPVRDNPALHFCLLAEMAKRHNLPFLSMGMSADFETAIRYGATHIRVGTAVFGERPQ